MTSAPAPPSPTKGYHSVSAEYRTLIPESAHLTWDDDFFAHDDEEQIVAAFDFDYENIIWYHSRATLVNQLAVVILFSIYMLMFDVYLALVPWGLYLLSLAPCLVQSQWQWEAYSRHLAVTRDGIRYINDRRKSWWGLSVCDRGKHSKTVPFDMITDCDIVEPAGRAACWIVPNILMRVHVDTASSGGEKKAHELNITGLKDPKSFKKLVWAMKRAKSGNMDRDYVPPKMVEMTSMLQQREGSCGTNEEVSGLLRDIRDELRQHNDLLRQQKPDSADAAELV